MCQPTVPKRRRFENGIADGNSGIAGEGARRKLRVEQQYKPEDKFLPAAKRSCRVGVLAHHLSLMVGEYTHPTRMRDIFRAGTPNLARSRE